MHLTTAHDAPSSLVDSKHALVFRDKIHKGLLEMFQDCWAISEVDDPIGRLELIMMLARIHKIALSEIAARTRWETVILNGCMVMQNKIVFHLEKTTEEEQRQLVQEIEHFRQQHMLRLERAWDANHEHYEAT